jgi:hypothetical protein
MYLTQLFILYRTLRKANHDKSKRNDLEVDIVAYYEIIILIFLLKF